MIGGQSAQQPGRLAVVISQLNGTWGTAREVSGTAALNTGGIALVTSVSCAKVSNGSVGESYTGSGADPAFVVNKA